ncbi:MAG: ribokinase [Bacteroidaceae bacterium]|nr:ribokinase [Bacteroidaceae bacterium]
MTPDILCIGHITHDRIVTPDRDVHMPGGTSFYFSYGLRHLMGDRKDINYRLITSLAEKDMKAVEDMRREGIEVEVIPSRETVYFENIYGANQNNRRQRVRAKADPFTCEKLGDISARYIVLGTLLADDFDLEALRYLSERGTLVVDAQGYLREVRGEEVHAIDWKEKREALRYVDILKVNEYEIEVLTGVTDQHRACELLAEWGVKEVLLTLGSYGSVVYADGRFYDIPAYDPLNVVDATGCGDTYVMAYVYRRLLGDDPGQAGRFASAVASIKLEASGPFCGTEADALARLRPTKKA